MSRTEYMSRLEELLADIPEDDRVDALNYYNDYFDAGGADNEEETIISLGSPEDLARTIKLASGDNGVIDGEFTETGYSNGINDTRDVPDKYTQITHYDGCVNGEKNFHIFGKEIDKSRLLLLIAILVLVAPVVVPAVFGFIGGAIGILFGLFGSLIGTVFGLFASGISIIVGSLVGIVAAVLSLVTKPLGAFTVLGYSMLGLALGNLMMAGCRALARLIPAAFRLVIKGVKWIVRLVKRIIFGKEID